MNEIIFYHPYNHEQRVLDVLTITATYVTVVWPLAGAYDLNLKNNVLTARSLGARRRNLCLWKALDIEAVREAVKIYMAKQNIKDVVSTARAEHEKSMPREKKYPYAVRK